jgi:hypothetical protein
MSRRACTLVLAAVLAAMNLAGMTAVAQAHTNDDPASTRHRALGQVELLATAAATPPSGTQGQADQRRALYQSELERTLQQRTQAGDEAAAGHGLAAQRKALYQSELERTLARHRALGALDAVAAPPAVAARPAARTDPAAPSPGVDVVATLLVGLVGGLVGGAAVVVGWTAASRRRLHRAAAGT